MHIARYLGVHKEALRTWVRHAKADVAGWHLATRGLPLIGWEVARACLGRVGRRRQITECLADDCDEPYRQPESARVSGELDRRRLLLASCVRARTDVDRVVGHCSAQGLGGVVIAAAPSARV